MEENTVHFEDLDLPVITSICSKLQHARDLANVSQTNRLLHGACSDTETWKAAYMVISTCASACKPLGCALACAHLLIQCPQATWDCTNANDGMFHGGSRQTSGLLGANSKGQVAVAPQASMINNACRYKVCCMHGHVCVW